MSVTTLANTGVVLQVFDLIDVLLDAPISKLLIVTGVIFLLVAVLGRIPGGPDAGDRGRQFGALFGVLLLSTGLVLNLGLVDPDPDNGGLTTTDAPPTETITPTPTQRAPTSTVYTTPNLEVVQYPQGYDRSGFADPDMALAAHGRALKRESFEGTYTARSDRGTLEITVKADPDTRRVHKVLVVNDSVSSELFYDAGDVTTRQPGEQGFSSDVPTYVAAAYIEGELDWFSYSALSDPQVHRQAGRTVISYYVTSTRADRDHEGELTVTETGLVLQFSLRVETDQETFFVEHRLRDLGETTVERPGWVADSES